MNNGILSNFHNGSWHLHMVRCAETVLFLLKIEFNSMNYEQVCIPVGCVPPACRLYPVVSEGGGLPRGCLPGGFCLGACKPRGVCPWGDLPRGVYPSMQWGRQPPPPRTESQADVKTLPRGLRPARLGNHGPTTVQ